MLRPYAQTGLLRRLVSHPHYAASTGPPRDRMQIHQRGQTRPACYGSHNSIRSKPQVDLINIVAEKKRHGALDER